jgi:uncharacterized protein YbbC (DUF1343 family)
MSCAYLPGNRENIKKNSTGKEIVIEETEKSDKETLETISARKLLLGVERLGLYIDSLEGKRVAVVSNQTGMVGNTHLVDTLLSLGVNVTKVFAPEHGFRGTADAGEKVSSTVDARTGLPIVSLYGNNKKPSAKMMEDIDLMVYDIQDVGVRFYTYISTLHYVMESCAEAKIPLYVLDRPNPNGHYIDGPIREPAFKSFVGMHPVPIVYGMTIGEYALMLNGEYWLSDSLQCNLRIVPCKNYYHKMRYELPIPPSPNLKSPLAISLYPSLCLFEATTVSVGRGTQRPFEWYGHPKFPESSFSFTPASMEGAKNPMYENLTCYAYDLAPAVKSRIYQINLFWLQNAYIMLKDSVEFITNEAFFNRLAGNNTLLEQIKSGKTIKEIRASWKPGLDQFRKTRSKYLLYD